MVVTDTKKESANSSNQVHVQPVGTKTGHSSAPQPESNVPLQNNSTASTKLAPNQNTSTQQSAQNKNGALAQGAPKPNVQESVQTQAISAPQSNGQTEASATAPQSNAQTAQVAAPKPNGQAKPSAQSNAQTPSAQAQQTREQIKKEQTQANKDAAGAEQQEAETQTKGSKRARVRLIPIWLRIIIIILAMTFSLLIGTMVGYGAIGGGNAWDVLKQSTWTHIVDIINKE